MEKEINRYAEQIADAARCLFKDAPADSEQERLSREIMAYAAAIARRTSLMAVR